MTAIAEPVGLEEGPGWMVVVYVTQAEVDGPLGPALPQVVGQAVIDAISAAQGGDEEGDP
jgi:hypothetical protein